VDFRPVSPGTTLTISPEYTGLTAPGEAEVHIRVHPTEYQGPSLGIPSFRSNNWVVYMSEGGFAVEFGKESTPPDTYKYTAFLDRERRSGDLYFSQKATRNNSSTIGLPPPMLDEILTLELLASRRGLMFHACGIAINSQHGLMFAGTSGSGKTTTARLWQSYSEAQPFGDERVVVRSHDDQFHLYSTPWYSTGQAIIHGSASLQQVFILSHDLTNHVRRLEPAEAVPLLLVRSYLPSWNANGMESTLEFLQGMCEALPCYLLGFTPDKRAVEFVQCLKDI